MKYKYLTEEKLNQFIDAAILEDVGDGDHSSLACVPTNASNRARLIIKDEGILAGVELAQMIFARVDSALSVEIFKNDGDFVVYGDIGLIVTGNAQSILKAERLVLNCMQRMSGIATQTFRINELIKHTKAKLLDTRKTTPNVRLIEKWAVAIGGGTNHRFGLYDQIMLKDNHIAYAGSISKAIIDTKNYLERLGKTMKIEVETQNLDEVKEVLAVGGIHIVMLDNMDIPTMQQAVHMIGSRFLIEASGGITIDTIKEVAECGVDYISVGALTHSIKSMDISLKAMKD